MKRSIIIYATLILIFSLITAGNIQTIRSSLTGLDQLQRAEIELDNVKTNTAILMSQIEYAKTDEYLEKEALERFKLVKEPSTVLIVEGAKTIEQKEEEQKAQQTTTENKTTSQKWLEFFKF